MPLSQAVAALSIIAGFMASMLIALTLIFEKDKKKARILLLWGSLLLAAAFGLAEYAFWLEGSYLFTLILSFNFPLIAYFLIWFGFLIWAFESRGGRKIWIMLCVLLALLAMAALACPDCIRP